MTSQAEQISPRDNAPNRIESQTQNNDGLAEARVFDMEAYRNAVTAAGQNDLTVPHGFPNSDLIIGNTIEQEPKQLGNKPKDDDRNANNVNRNESGDAGRNESGDAHRNESGDADRNDRNSGNENKIEGMKPKIDFGLQPHQRLDLPKAVARLDALIDQNLSERDQNIMRDLHASVLTGDSHGLSDTLMQFKNNPQELQRFTRMLNENLSNADTGLAATTEGNSLLLLGTRDRAVQISMDGRVSVRQLDLNRDGSVSIGAHLHTESPAVVMSVIGRQAREHMALMDAIRPTR